MNRLRILFIVVAGLFGFLLAGCNSSSENVNGWQADKELVAKQYRHGSDFNYDESKVPDYVLPELLTAKDGSKIRSSKKWEEIRRNEILELFRDNVYGRVPATSYNETFNVVEKDNNALNGTAVYKHIEIAIAKNPDTLIINLLLFTPKRNEPSPVFLLICNRDKNNIDPTRVHKSPFWPVEEIIAGGYGAAAFFNGDVDPDNYDEFKNGIHGMLDEGRREACSWGTLAAWAWGAGKCMDYLVTDSDVDKNKVAVLGHSRGGKTALWAGAEDQRFGMVISNESGCGGAALARRKYGETIKRINTSFPHWFCTNYTGYNDKEDELPVDMHELLALVAPRPLYVACADEDLWGDPKGSYLALYASQPAFNLYKTKSNLPASVPALNKQIISGNTGFHIRQGSHNLLLEDWQKFMDFADAVWK